MRHGLLTSAILGLTLLAGSAGAQTFDAAVKRGALKVCIVETAPYAIKTPRGHWIGHEVDVSPVGHFTEYLLSISAIWWLVNCWHAAKFPRK